MPTKINEKNIIKELVPSVYLSLHTFLYWILKVVISYIDTPFC